MKNYDRRTPPAYINYFENKIESKSILDFSNKLDIKKINTELISFQKPIKIDNNNNPTHPLFSEFQGNTSIYLSYLPKAIINIETGAIILSFKNQYFLIQESLQYSRLHFDSDFRCDKNTNWNWEWNKEKITRNTLELDEEGIGICLTREGIINQYYHWFFDGLAKVYPLIIANQKYSKLLLSRNNLKKSYQVQALNKFNIPKSKILHTEVLNTKYISVKNAIFPFFIFKEPIGLRPEYKTKTHYRGISANYVNFLSQKITSLPNDNISKNQFSKIYVSRKDAYHRKLINEEQIENSLKTLGFKIICPGEYSFEEQVHFFSNAQVVIGLHGAGLTNCLWMKANSILIELFPNKFDDPGYRMIATLKNLNYYVYNVDTISDEKGIAYANCQIDSNNFLNYVSNIIR